MFKGKAIGSILAAWMLQGCPEVGKAMITSYTDSQAFIKATGVRKSRSGQYLIMEYLRLTEAMTDGSDDFNPTGTAKFTLKWVAAHEGVIGNERVDEEAKKAAQGELSLMEELPPILRKHLPLSVAAVKQDFAEKQKVKWLEAWKVLPRYAKFQHVDPDFPFNKYRKISNKLSRAQASLLMQIWTGHIPLNSYLHRINKVANRCCDACWGIGQILVPETVIHFLFECQEYAEERYDMDRALGCHSRDLQGILESMDRIRELLKFIGRTARFKKTLGDAIGDVSNLKTEDD